MKKYLYSFLLLSLSATLFTACSDDDDDDAVTVEAEAGGESDVSTHSDGAFVLNEGNYYSSINGSLSYIDFDSSSITNGIFQAKNGRSLGGTPNSMVIDYDNDEMYIACTDENRVEITDDDAESITYVTISQPREMVVYGGYVYVTSYNGTVAKISTSTHEIVATSETVGACLEGIAARDGYIYVCNAYNADYTYNTNVVELDASTLEKVSDITVAQNPTAIKADGTDLYVLSTGNYYDVQAQIQKIDSSNNVTYICDGTLFDVYDSKLYVINSVTDWTTYETSTTYSIYSSASSYTTFEPPYEIASPCAIAVDPCDGDVFISSYVMGSYGYADYTADGYVVVFSTDDTSNYEVYTAGVGPCTIVFDEED